METDEQLEAHTVALLRAKGPTSSDVKSALDSAWRKARASFTGGCRVIEPELSTDYRHFSTFRTVRGKRMIAMYIRDRALEDGELRTMHGLVDVHVSWDDPSKLLFRCKSPDRSSEDAKVVGELSEIVLAQSDRSGVVGIDAEDAGVLSNPVNLQALERAVGRKIHLVDRPAGGDGDPFLCWDAKDRSVPAPDDREWDTVGLSD